MQKPSFKKCSRRSSLGYQGYIKCGNYYQFSKIYRLTKFDALIDAKNLEKDFYELSSKQILTEREKDD